ncbi:MAG: hypothetical protein ACTHMD_02435, partial [Flavisolibacter sp.]
LELHADNIFFKEQQSQTRKRVLKTPMELPGYVVYLAFIASSKLQITSFLFFPLDKGGNSQ